MTLHRITVDRSRAGLSQRVFVLSLLLMGSLVGVAIYATRGSQPPVEAPALPVSNAEEYTGPSWFEERTIGSGLEFTHHNGEEANQFTILETLGGGIALLDYDGDGRLDVLASGGGRFGGPTKTELIGEPCRLFRNLGGWHFEEVTAAAGIGKTNFYNHGLAVADFDRDGWPDFVITGYGQIQLYRNTAGPGGSRRFEEVSRKVNLIDTSWSTSAAWGDINGDGWPDLYVCHYVDWSFQNNPICVGYHAGVERDVCAPQRFKPLIHALYINEQGERFREAGAEQEFQAKGCGLGVVVADLNGDAKPDLYVANDATDNFLFFNRNGKLKESAWLAGAAGDENGRFNGSMGADVFDFDGSGRASIWVTNFQGELSALFRNLGHASPHEAFDHHSRSSGIASIGSHLVSFGTAAFDADGDGWEDLVIVNGHVIRQPTLGSTFRQKPVMLQNVDRGGRRGFMEVSNRCGPYFQKPELGRGLAIGDLDNDGRTDLVVSHTNSPVALLRGAMADSTWVGFRLRGRNHRDVVGSTITLEADGRTLTRFIKSGGSYLSSSDPRVLFRLPAGSKPGKLTVRWSWGETQNWDCPAPGTYWELHEGEPQPRPLASPP